MKSRTKQIDGIISWNEIHDIWMETGQFIPYPQVLHRRIEQRASVEDWPSELKNVALEISDKIKRLDYTTGLETPDNFQKNKVMFREYKKYQKQHPDLLKELRVVRIWGDISNMGGLNIALSQENEPMLDDKKSVAGIRRANKFIRLIAEVVKAELTGCCWR